MDYPMSQNPLPFKLVQMLSFKIMDVIIRHEQGDPLKYNAVHVLVANPYNPSYSGGRDQEDHSSKPAQANSSRDTILCDGYFRDTHHIKRASGVAQGVGPEFKP
jgi:hypothetical protein